MKNFRKAMAMVLSVALVLSSLCLAAGAADVQKKYPLVFVHGMGGWGSYEESYASSPYWGGMMPEEGQEPADAIKLLNDNGYEAYAASVGPISSAWDRACELYAQLTGTVTDFGAAHSKAHRHSRYGSSFEGRPLMGEAWDMDEAISLIGHSFGAPTVRLFASLVAYGDSAEREATGADTSPLFAGGHEDSIHSVITLAGPNNGSQMSNLICDPKLPVWLITLAANIVGTLKGNSYGNWTLRLSQFGLTSDSGKARLSFSKIANFAFGKDNCGYDLTLKGAAELNERIKLCPKTYYYSYSGVATKESGIFGRQKPDESCSDMLSFASWFIGATQGMKIDGIKITKEWAINDGIVPLASSMYPLNNADTALPYEPAAQQGTIEPGRWYYKAPIAGLDHTAYCTSSGGYPVSFEAFYLELAQLSCSK